MFYKIFLVVLLLFAMYTTYKLFQFLKFFFIEKWIAYLDFRIEDVFRNVYMTELMTWIANQTLPDVQDKEFLQISRRFIKDVSIQLGKMKNFYFTIFSKDDFREYILLKFITLIYETAGKDVINQTLNDLKEQNKSDKET